MSRSSRRLSFAAPLVLIAACHPSPKKEPPIHENPPAASRYAEWNVAKSGDTCYADTLEEMSCPPDASCNPPPPMSIQCPEGLEEGASLVVYQAEENGPCYIDGETATEIACPSWGEE
jgi:hypothetical protein